MENARYLCLLECVFVWLITAKVSFTTWSHVSNVLFFRIRWLRQKGSPDSIIDRTDFTNSSEIPEYTFDSFKIRK